MQIDELRRALLDAAGEEPPSDPGARAAVDRRVRRHQRVVVALTAGVAVAFIAVALGAFVAVRSGDRVVPANDVPRREGVEVEVFLNVSTPADRADAVRRALAVDPDVLDFEFVSEAQAVEEFRQRYADQPDAAASVEVGDLPASFRVTLAAGADPDAFAERIERLDFVDEAIAQPSPEQAAAVCEAARAATREFLRLRRLRGEVEVFLRLDASPEDEAALRAALGADPDVVEAEFISQARAVEEARQLFADQPDLAASIDVGEVPASFRLRLRDGVNADDVAGRYSGRPEVDEVTTIDSSPSGLEWLYCESEQRPPP